MPTPCFLTLLGEPLHNYFHKNIIKTFEDFDYCSPKNYDDIDTVLSIMVEKAITSKEFSEKMRFELILQARQANVLTN